MKEVRLGTIGSGFIVHYILNNVKRTEGVTLAAVYSRTEEKGRELASEYDCDVVYTDLDQLMADENVNTVYVASPNLLHYEQAKKALLAGKHVWCEKPFCTTETQAEELIRIAEEKGLYLVETAPTTFLPNYKILKEQLPKIGRIRLIQGSFCQYSSRYDALLRGEVTNIFNPQMAGGALMDINFYNVILCTALFGAPENAAYYANILKPVGCDTSGIALLSYPDFKAELCGAKDTWGENSFQIHSENGYIYVSGGPQAILEVRVVTKETDETFNEQDETDRWYYEIQELTRLFLEDRKEEIDSRHSLILDTVHTMCALRKDAGLRYPNDPD